MIFLSFFKVLGNDIPVVTGFAVLLLRRGANARTLHSLKPTCRWVYLIIILFILNYFT